MKCEELEVQLRDAEKKRYAAEERLSDVAEQAMEMCVKIGQQKTNDVLTKLDEAYAELVREHMKLGEKHVAALEAMEATKSKADDLKKMLKDSFEKNKLFQSQVEANMDSKLKRAFDQIKMLKSELANLQEKYDAARQRLDPEVSDATSGCDYEDEDEASHMQCMHALAEEMAGRRVSKARFNWVLDEWERNTGEEFNAEAVTAAFDSGFFDDNCRKRLPTCCATAKSS